MAETTSSGNAFAPNMRFGTSFLSFDKHKNAVNDEVIIDKRTGQLVYKRNTDGKLIYYSQENIHLNNYMRQLKTLMQNHRKSYIRPIPTNCEYCDDTFFMSYNIETIDFYFDENSDKQRLIDGGVWLNPKPTPHSFTQETNGFFINLVGRPRDRALVSFLAALYDRYYKNYTGDDPDSLAKKELYKLDGYDLSNAVVNYTVTYYTSTDEVYARQTADGYVRINEVSFVPFPYEGIYPRTSVAYAKIQINSISVPKLAEGMRLISTATEQLLYNRILDYDDVAFISCNVSIFTTTTDQSFTVPEETNCTPLLIMGWEEFEEELVNAKSGGGSDSGIVISVDEPDETVWEDITIWGELIHTVHGTGEVDDTGAITDIDELEKNFGSIEYHNAKFTTDVTDVDDYYVNTPET